eukprot:1862621-Lingulodinium_polyedra.AAC.1
MEEDMRALSELDDAYEWYDVTKADVLLTFINPELAVLLILRSSAFASGAQAGHRTIARGWG